MRFSVTVIIVTCTILEAATALRFQPIDWHPRQLNAKRDAGSVDLDPETIRLLASMYRTLQNDFELQREAELKRKLWPAYHVNSNNVAVAQDENALNAVETVKKSSGRNTRNYKNCFLSPVQCVMKGRA